MKRYITLSILLLIGLFCLQIIATPSTPSKSLVDFDSETIAKLANHPYIATVTAIYSVLFLIGIMYLAIYGVTLLRRQPLLEQVLPRIPFSLSGLDTSRLFFYLLSLIFFAQIVSSLTLHVAGKLNAYNLTVIFNFVVEIGVILILMRFLTAKITGLSAKNCRVATILKLYTALLPLLMISLFLNSFILQNLGIKPTTNPAIDLFLLLNNKFFIGLLILQIIIIAPIAEELLFRGLIFKLLRKKYSFFIAAAFTSLIFALIHRASLNILPLFIISFAFAYLYEKTQNIATPMILHSIHNAINLSLLIGLKLGLNP